MKYIEDIVQHYQPQATPLTAAEKTRILQRTLQLAEISKAAPDAELPSAAQPNGKKRFRMSVLIAACIAIFAFAAVAFAASELDKNFLAIFQANNEKESQTLSDLSTDLNANATVNGLTIYARQAVGDADNVYILLDLIGPPDMPLSLPQYDFMQAWVRVSGSKALGYYFDYLPDEDPNDNQKSLLLALSAAKGTQGKQMELTFRDFSRYKTEDELQQRPAVKAGDTSWGGTAGDANDDRVVLIPGEWNLTFDLNYRDGTVRYPLNQEISVNGQTLKAKELRLSPISASVTLKSGFLNYLEDAPSSYEPPKLTVLMKNGDVIDGSASGASTEPGLSGTKVVVTLSFQKIIDPAEIKQILLNDTVLDF